MELQRSLLLPQQGGFGYNVYYNYCFFVWEGGRLRRVVLSISVFCSIYPGSYDVSRQNLHHQTFLLLNPFPQCIWMDAYLRTHVAFSPSNPRFPPLPLLTSSLTHSLRLPTTPYHSLPLPTTPYLNPLSTHLSPLYIHISPSFPTKKKNTLLISPKTLPPSLYPPTPKPGNHTN